MATAARHRIGRIIAIVVRRLVRPRGIRVESTIAVPPVRLAERVQIVLSKTGTRNWPVGCVAPAVCTHYEHAHRSFTVGAIVLAFEPMVEPSKLEPIDRIGGLGSEICVTELGRPGVVYVRPNN